MSHFNYIITAHEPPIPRFDRVLAGVFRAASGVLSQIYVVCDGCSEAFLQRLKQLKDKQAAIGMASFTIIETPDVHELLSINAALARIEQDENDRLGYNIILQDDAILLDPNLEVHIEELYRLVPYAGYVSLRLGFNLDPTEPLTSNPLFPQPDEIESRYGAAVTKNLLEPGYFAFRTVPIKSPVCLPTYIVREVGKYNEALAPYAYDDLELALRITDAGYRNGVLALPFFSDTRWGASRRPGHPDIMPTARRNAAYIRENCSRLLRQAVNRQDWPYNRFQAVKVSIDEQDAAVLQWDHSAAVLKELNP